MEFIKDNLLVSYRCPEGVRIAGSYRERYARILSVPALRFLKQLHERFEERRKAVLRQRKMHPPSSGHSFKLDLSESSYDVRISDWSVSPIPPDLLDQRVVLEGGTDSKTMVEALNSGANIFVANLEDGNCPTWKNMMEAQVYLKEATNKNLSYYDSTVRQSNYLDATTATQMVKPRGWHLLEENIRINDEPISASLVDFGLYFFHNVKMLSEQGSGPYFCLTKLESPVEARLWNDLFVFAQDYMGYSQKTIKAALQVDHLLATLQLHEMIFELQAHCAGLIVDQEGYVCSCIRHFSDVPNKVFPEASQLSPDTPLLQSYAHWLIQAGHKRGLPVVGGLVREVPQNENEGIYVAASERIRREKLLEVKAGFDGGRVVHPVLVEEVKSVFDEHMPSKNQVANKRLDLHISEKDLSHFPKGTISEQGVRRQIRISILYLENWLKGTGMISFENEYLDASSLELCRCQIWQWIQHRARLADGRMLTLDLYKLLLLEELQAIEKQVGAAAFLRGKYTTATHLFDQLIQQENLVPYFTELGYELL